VLILGVANWRINKFFVHILTVHSSFSLTSTKHAPNISPKCCLDSIEHRFPNSFSRNYCKRIKLVICFVNVQQFVPLLIRQNTNVLISF
jgi:hypothetical protein